MLKCYLPQRSKIIILCYQKSDTLKLSPHLAQYLYINKELTLAGIGKFRMEASVSDEESVDKASKIISPAAISFEQNTSSKVDPELVAFIAAQSGKMKSLAAADLDSYLELAKQFLNIGKPFLFEGIGTLSKNKSDKYDFMPGYLLGEKGKESTATEADQTSTTEDSFKDYEEMFSPKKPQTPASKRIVLWLAILAGICLTVWGGYYVYTKTKKNKKISDQQLSSAPLKDSNTSSQIDTMFSSVKTDTSISRFYKYVIEEANRSRALTRYNDLKKWGINVQMETKDSVMFKLFFALSSTPSDTVRIRDSLSLLYSTMGKTTIEQ